MKELKLKAELLKERNAQCDVELLGWLKPSEINTFLNEHGINALILVSETEGLPVVIMEAFSASIPVIATNVGGVSELVNDKNGILLNANPKITEIANSIELLANESREFNEQRRVEAFKSYSACFSLERNSKTFIEFLAAQCH